MVMMRILLLAKRIHDRPVTSRCRLIVTRRELLKEERHDLIGSPPLGEKDVVDGMLWELLTDLHEVSDEFNTKPCTTPILRQDGGVAGEDRLYLLAWKSKCKRHQCGPPNDLPPAMFFAQKHNRIFFLKIAYEVVPSHAEKPLTKKVVKCLLFLFRTCCDFLCLAHDRGHSCFSCSFLRV